MSQLRVTGVGGGGAGGVTESPKVFNLVKIRAQSHKIRAKSSKIREKFLITF